jgi:hypothetical protein
MRIPFDERSTFLESPSLDRIYFAIKVKVDKEKELRLYLSSILCWICNYVQTTVYTIFIVFVFH